MDEKNLSTNRLLDEKTSANKYEFDDYEMLPTHSVSIHLAAGSAAGLMEHCIMYPIDSVKVRFLILHFNNLWFF